MSSPTPTPSACQSNAENDRTLVLGRFWLSIALLTATVMQVLDITIVSVALPKPAVRLAALWAWPCWVGWSAWTHPYPLLALWPPFWAVPLRCYWVTLPSKSGEHLSVSGYSIISESIFGRFSC